MSSESKSAQTLDQAVVQPETQATEAPAPSVFRQFHALTKPRVIQLIVFCALIGMLISRR